MKKYFITILLSFCFHTNFSQTDSYKKTLVEFSGLKESQEKLVKSVYLYILKKMKVPSTLELVWFHAFGKKKNLEARRMNIGAIFALISAQQLP